MQRCLISSEAVRIAQSGERLVHGVPRRPLSIEIECGCLDLTFRECIETLSAAFERTEISVALFILYQLEFGDDVIDAILEAFVAGCRPHCADGGEIVTGYVASQVATTAVPSTVWFGLLLEPSVGSIVRQHAIGLEFEQVLDIRLLRLLERATE